MQTVRKILLALTAAVLLAVMTPTSAFAATTGTVIYRNDFSSGDIDDTMTYLISGTYEFPKEDGNTFMRCLPITTGNRSFKINFGPEEAKNVDIEYKIRLLSSVNANNGRATMLFRSPTIPAHDLFGYQLRLYSAKVDFALMDNFADTNNVALTTNQDQTFKMGLWYNVKICLRDTRMTAYINGEQVLDWIDEYYPITGGFGISSYYMDFDIDDIVISQYTGALPEPTPNEAPAWAGNTEDEEEEDIADTGSPRLNLGAILAGSGGEGEGDGNGNAGTGAAVDVVDPNELTVNSYIAIGLIAALVVMAVSTLVVSLVLIKATKKEKEAPAAAATEAEQAQEAGKEE